MFAPSVGIRAGTKLGPYEVFSPFGAVGMGGGYCARDAGLGNGKGNDFAIGSSKMLFEGKRIPPTADGKKLVLPVDGDRGSTSSTLVADGRRQLKN